MANYISVVDAANLYINNMIPVWTDDNSTSVTFSISAGQCRNSTNTCDINVGNYLGMTNPAASQNVVTVVNGNVNGLNGLDVGNTISTGSWYYIYAIGDSSSKNPNGYILSLSGSIPTLPGGYDVYRLIGYIRASFAFAEFSEFYVNGAGNARFLWFKDVVGVLTDGSSTTNALVNLSAVVPPIDNILVTMNVVFTANTAGDSVQLRIATSPNTDTPIYTFYNPSTTTNFGGGFEILSRLVGGVPSIAYKNTPGGLTSLVGIGFKYSV